MLLDSLPEGVIRWDHRLGKIEDVDGAYHLHFRDRLVETGFDLVVGADGCWSHVRDLLTINKPYYCGISGVVFTI